MKLHLILPVFFCMLANQILAQQNIGVNTTSPQANLHVNGTFKLENGVIVNGISNDSTFTPGSDSLLPTQLAVKKYLKHGFFAPKGEGDSILILRDTFPADDVSCLFAVGDLLYVTLQAANQLMILDISNPDSIVFLGSTSTNINAPEDVEVKNGIAYVINHITANYGFAIFNVSDPANIIPLDYTNEGIGSPWCIEVKSNIAYVGCSGFGSGNGFVTYDVTDPNNIIFLDGYGSPLHNTVSIKIHGNLAYAVSNSRLSILNVENPADIQLLSTTTTNMSIGSSDVIVKDNYAYVPVVVNNRVCIFDVSNPNSIVAQGFITEGLHAPQFLGVIDQKMIVQCSGNNRIRVYDLSIPRQPQLIHTLNGFAKQGMRFNTQGNFVYSVTTMPSNPLAILEWTCLPEYRNLTLLPDGTTRFDFATWQRDSIGNVYKINGKVGIGLSSPTSALHIIGDEALHVGGRMRIDGANTLEFGAGVSGKQGDAGKIGYNTFSGNALDIVGAGQTGSRKIKFFAEGGSQFDGPMVINGTNTLEFGAGIFGKQIDAGKIGYNTFSGNALDIIGAGTTGSRKLRFYAEGGSQFDGPVFITNNVGILNSTPTAPLHLSGKMKIDGNNTLEFGAGIVSKHVDAGKIGYNAISPDALDISGAGQNGARKVNVYAEGGTTFSGKAIVQDSLIINGNSKMNGNLIINNGQLGIGTTAPAVPLHLAGAMKVDGTNTIEFGAGIPGKNGDAGKIGSQTFSADALDIVGAGPTNNRKLTFHADGGSLFTHSIQVNQNVLVNGNVGIGVTNPIYRLDVNGRIRVRHTGATAGIFFNGSNNLENGFFGMQNDSLMGMYANLIGTWGILMNTYNNRIGIGNISPLATLHVNGTTKIQSQYTMEFGAGLPGKHQDAGKIGYNAFTSDALDIIGAGATPGERKVKISDVLQVEKIVPKGWLDLSSSFQNGWSNYNNGFATTAVTKDQLGVVRFRGTIHGGSIVPGTIIFTLQPEYRPSYGKVVFMIPNDNTFARIEIHPTGEALFFGANNVSLSLDQISFRVD